MKRQKSIHHGYLKGAVSKLFVFEIDLHLVFFKGVLEAVSVLRKDQGSCAVSLEAVGGDIIDGPGSRYVTVPALTAVELSLIRYQTLPSKVISVVVFTRLS